MAASESLASCLPVAARSRRASSYQQLERSALSLACAAQRVSSSLVRASGSSAMSVIHGLPGVGSLGGLSLLVLACAYRNLGSAGGPACSVEVVGAEGSGSFCSA